VPVLAPFGMAEINPDIRRIAGFAGLGAQLPACN